MQLPSSSPTFWAQQPEVWFLQAEAQFYISKTIDDTTKYLFHHGRYQKLQTLTDYLMR